MRRKAENSATKNKILFESFKLFTCKPWSDVVYQDIEKATGFSRGAILYHIQTKENLFNEVMKKYVFERRTSCMVAHAQGLWNNILLFLSMRENEKKEFEAMGIMNINRAYTYIACNALYCGREMNVLIDQWINGEFDYWKTLLTEAVKNEEIKADIDIELEARLFLKVFLGTSYSNLASSTGYSLEILKSEFKNLYDKLKK